MRCPSCNSFMWPSETHRCWGQVHVVWGGYGAEEDDAVEIYADSTSEAAEKWREMTDDFEAAEVEEVFVRAPSGAVWKHEVRREYEPSYSSDIGAPVTPPRLTGHPSIVAAAIARDVAELEWQIVIRAQDVRTTPAQDVVATNYWSAKTAARERWEQTVERLAVTP